MSDPIDAMFQYDFIINNLSQYIDMGLILIFHTWVDILVDLLVVQAYQPIWDYCMLGICKPDRFMFTFFCVVSSEFFT